MSQQLLLQIYHQSCCCVLERGGGQVGDWLFWRSRSRWKGEALCFLTGWWWGCCVSAGPRWAAAQSKGHLHGEGGGTPPWARRGGRSLLKQPPSRHAFQLHDEAFGGETDGSVKLRSYAAANLAVIMRWLKRGRKRGGAVPCGGDTTMLGFATQPIISLIC